MQAIGSGDEMALYQLYERYSERMYNLALSYLQEVKGAEEATQDTFMKAWKGATGFKGNSQVSSWLYRICVNVCLTMLQGQKRRINLLSRLREDETPRFYHPEVAEVQRDKNRQLYAAIYQLPTRQKTAFVLAYVEELSRQEIADVMQSSLKSVESLLMRAKANLRQILTKSDVK